MSSTTIRVKCDKKNAMRQPQAKQWQALYGTTLDFHKYKDPGNCKITTISYIQYALATDPIATAEAIKKAVPRFFIVKLTEECFVDELAKHFDIVTVTKVPIGYNNKPQWHVVYNTGTEYADRYKGKDIKGKLSILDNKSELADFQIAKLMSYKSPYFFKRYLKKVINATN